MNRPKGEKIVMAADDFRFVKTVGARGHVLVFVPGQRPELPAMQSLAVTKMEKRIEIIIRHHIMFAGLAVNRKHHEKNVVVKQPIFEMAVKWNKRGVIFTRVRRTLLEINREKCETSFQGVVLFFASGKTE